MGCDVLKGLATGIQPVVLKLLPGQPQRVLWDFTGCSDVFAAYNVEFFLTQPRTRNGQKLLPSGTPLVYSMTNLTTGQVYTGPNFTIPVGEIHSCQLALDVEYKGTKSLSVEVSYSAAF